MAIQFIQFLFPKGHERIINIETDQEVEEKSQDLVEKGYAFEIENFNEMIWASIICHEKEEAVDALFPNNHDVPKKINELVGKAWDKFIWSNL